MHLFGGMLGLLGDQQGLGERLAWAGGGYEWSTLVWPC